MFRFLYRVSRYSNSKTFVLCFPEKPFLVRSIATASTTSSSSSNASANDNSFTISYLINSCGLSQDKAISASKSVQFETSARPDSVLTLFRDHEISDTHIARIIQVVPTILMADPDKILKPKIDFLKTLGLAGPDLSKILFADPKLLKSSLEKRIIPSIAFLKSLVHTDANIVSLLKKSTWVVRDNVQRVLTPNIEVLRAHGVPDYNISMLLVIRPRALLLNINKFKNIVQEVVKMGFDPSKYLFCEGIRRLVSISESTRDAKIGVYKKWGWSEEEIYSAFSKEPNCIGLSEETIMLKMNFFVKKLGYDPLLIAQYPAVLKYSLENRIIPRARVIQILISKGLVEKNGNLYSIFVTPGKYFMEKFVLKYEEKVPELVNAYQRKAE